MLWCRSPFLLRCLPQKNYLSTAWHAQHFDRYVCCMPNKLLGKGKASLCISLPGVTTRNIAEIEGKVLHGTLNSGFPVLTYVTPDPAIFISSSILSAFVQFPCLSPSLLWTKKQTTLQMQTLWEIVTHGLFQLQRKWRWCLNPSVLWSEITFLSGLWEKCFFRLYLSAVSSPVGAEAAESVPNEVSRDAHFRELDTGLKCPEMAFLGPFSCQQHNMGPFGAECTPIKEVKKPAH